MKNLMLPVALAAGLFTASSNGFAAVEYVKVCEAYGAGFNFVPGTDICLNPTTGDARQATSSGTWRSLLPYPEGKWVTTPDLECPGRLVKIGAFKSTDFTLNPWQRKQTLPVPLRVFPNEFISKVIMKGGFYDPRLVPVARHGVNSTDGLCLRSIDPRVLEAFGPNLINPPYGNGFLPIGCVANSRILGMPAAYSISATAAYPNIDTYFPTANPTPVASYLYGSAVVVTTDFGHTGPDALTYIFDNTGPTPVTKPLAGTLSVWACMEGGGFVLPE